MKSRYIALGAVAMLGLLLGTVNALWHRNSDTVHYSLSLDYRRSVPEFVASGDGIILGTVTAVTSAKEKAAVRPDEESIVTAARIKIEEYLLNPRKMTDSEITVKTLGGKVGDEELIAEDAPRFTVGERVIVFLGVDPNTHEYYVYGSAQGKYHVNDDGSIGSEAEMENVRETLGIKSGVATIQDLKKKIVESQKQ